MAFILPRILLLTLLWQVSSTVKAARLGEHRWVPAINNRVEGRISSETADSAPLIGTPSPEFDKLNTTNQFDYFYFVREWGNTFCSNNNCTRAPTNAFTIHGLWPEYAAGGWPEFCSGPDFDVGLLNDLRPALEAEWPSLLLPEDGFWGHEWGRHGTCALSLFGDEHAYFSSALSLHAKFDIALALRRAKITPSPSRTYSARSIASALRKAFGFLPQLHCLGGKLNEVWMCVGKDLYPMACPNPAPFPCLGKVMIPSHK